MKLCTNPDVGNMILAYELGQLAGVELEKFEQHLFECESCSDEVFEDHMFIKMLKTAIRENISVASIIDFSQLKNYPRDQLTKLREALQTTLEIFRQTPKQRVIYADTEGEKFQRPIEAVVRNIQGNTIGHTEICILEKPRITRGVFTVELEITEKRYIDYEISVGIKLNAEGITLTTEYDTIPSDRIVFVREEIGIEGDYKLHPDMLIITVVGPHS